MIAVQYDEKLKHNTWTFNKKDVDEVYQKFFAEVDAAREAKKAERKLRKSEKKMENNENE